MDSSPKIDTSHRHPVVDRPLLLFAAIGKIAKYMLLSAIHTIFLYWVEKGMREAHPFSSYKRWGRIIGGMMNLLEFGDPTLPHETDAFVTSDQRTTAMKAVFELLYDHKPEIWIDKKDVTTLVAANQENDPRLDWFGDLSGEHTKRKANQRLGQALGFFDGRWLSGIRLEIDQSQANIVRRQMRFTKSKPAS